MSSSLLAAAPPGPALALPEVRPTRHDGSGNARVARGGEDRAAADDERLLAWAAAGDRAAMDVLALRHLPRLYAVALRLTGRPDLAEEVAQDAVLRAWTHAARFDPSRARFGTWVHRIAVNLALDRLRAAGARPTLPLDEAPDLPDPADDPEQSLARRQRRVRVLDALAALPPRQRAALALSHGGGLDGAQAAAVLRTSARAVEGLLRRARGLLAARLREEDGS